MEDTQSVPSSVVKELTSAQFTRSARKNTVFKTPRSRRLTTTVGHAIRRSPRRRSSGEISYSEDIIANKTWKLYRLSPLFRFSDQPKDLKKYSTSLASFIAGERAKNFDIDLEKVEKAVFKVIKDVKVSAVDPEAVQIVITGKKNGDSESGKVLLTAVMCGVDMEKNPIEGNEKDFTFFPLMLLKSTIMLSQSFVSWMERQFDCRMSPLSLNPYQLSWILSMWSGLTSDKANKPIKLVYTVPSEVEGLKQINYIIDPHDCKELWERIHNRNTNIFTEEEVSEFMSNLETHFFNCFHINISAMSLTSTGTPVAYCDGSGKIKIFSHKHITKVLRYLTELSLEQFIQI